MSASPIDAIVDEARIQEVDAVFLPLWAWRYPLRRFRASRTARALARQLSCAVLLGDWMPGTGQSLAAAAATASPYQPVATGPDIRLKEISVCAVSRHVQIPMPSWPASRRKSSR